MGLEDSQFQKKHAERDNEHDNKQSPTLLEHEHSVAAPDSLPWPPKVQAAGDDLDVPLPQRVVNDGLVLDDHDGTRGVHDVATRLGVRVHQVDGRNQQLLWGKRRRLEKRIAKELTTEEAGDAADSCGLVRASSLWMVPSRTNKGTSRTSRLQQKQSSAEIDSAKHMDRLPND